MADTGLWEETPDEGLTLPAGDTITPDTEERLKSPSLPVLSAILLSIWFKPYIALLLSPSETCLEKIHLCVVNHWK